MRYLWKIFFSSVSHSDIVTEYLADSDLLTKLDNASRQGFPLGDSFNFSDIPMTQLHVSDAADIRSWVCQICVAMEVRQCNIQLVSS